MNYDYDREFKHYAEMHRALERANAKVPAEVIQAIAAIRSSVELIKGLNSYADSVKDTQKRGELMRIIGELNIELGNAQIQLAQQQVNAYQMTQKIEDLEKEIEALKNPSIEIVKGNKGLYYVKGREDEPICIACYDSTGKAIRMDHQQPGHGMEFWSCGNCKAKAGIQM